MAFAPEAVQSDHDVERKSAESDQVKEAAGPEASPVLGGFLSALAADGSNGSNHRLLSNPVMQRASGGEMRVLVMRRAQQGVGNHKTQRLVAQLQRPSLVQRQCSCGGTCESCQSKSSEALEEKEETGVVQRQVAGASGAEATVPYDVIPADSSGHPLDHGARGFMESRFGTDFSDVRVHTDSRAAESADALAANAYTTGRDIYFAAGKYAPASRDGRHLLAHELTHTVQKGNGAMPMATTPAGGVVVGDARDPLEAEAEHAAEEVVSCESASSEAETPKHLAVAAANRFVQRQPSPSADAGGNAPGPYTGPPPGAQKAENDAPPPGKDGQKSKLPKPPDPKGELVVNTDTGVTFTDNVEYVRYQLQFFVATHGTDRLDVFLSGFYRFGSGLGPLIGPPQATTPQRTDYFERVVKLVRSEVKFLKLTMAQFLSDFERRAHDKLNEMLDASKARVEKERARYDVKKEDSGHSVETGKETEDLTRRSRDLLSKQAAVVAAKAALERAQPYGPHGELPPGGAPKQEEVDAEKAARDKLNDAQRVYSLARSAAEVRHPILVGYHLDPLGPVTAETLQKLGSTSSTVQADTLAGKIDNTLESIAKVRKDVADDYGKVWELHSVVEATKTYPDIKNYRGLTPGVTSTLLAEKAGAIQAHAELVGLFTGVTLIIIALIAAVPTGGLSLGTAAVVAGAQVLEAGLLAFTAYQATEKYLFDLAASGTDFDKAKAISDEEPSWFWVALDIVGAVIALPKALSAFRRLVSLRRMAAAAKAAGKLTEAEGLLSKLETEGDEVRKGLGAKVKGDAEQLAKAQAEHGAEFDEIAQNIRKKRPSSVSGYSEEIPLDAKGEHFWRKSSDGRTWCRFSPKPSLCFAGGSIEGRALEEKLLEIAIEDTSSAALRANILRSGMPVPPGNWQAHHIVPQALRDHPVVVFLREKFGFSLDSAENGVALPEAVPQTGPLAGRVASHSGSHAIYSGNIEIELDNLQTAWNNYSPNKVYSEFQKILDTNRARMIGELAGAPVR
jgi:hypothetical protein